MFGLVHRLTPKTPFEGRMRLQRGSLLTMPVSGAGLAAVGLIWTGWGVMLTWYAVLLVTVASPI